jgi:hypothetical protein
MVSGLAVCHWSIVLFFPKHRFQSHSAAPSVMSTGKIARRNGWRLRICTLAVVLIALIPLGGANAQSDWAATLYSGRLTDGKIEETVTANFSFEDAYYVGLGVMRRLYTYRHYFDLEIEGQIKKFFGDQDHWEFDLLGYIRWLPFPWDRYLDTSFAAGAGLSYATSLPAIEVKNQGKAARLLVGLAFEFTFALPRIPQWQLVAGLLHHRSGAGGTFSGVSSASNGLGIGIRYRF